MKKRNYAHLTGIGRYSLLPLLFFCLNAQAVLAQQTTITGRVTDELGDPLPFATVWLNGTTLGVETGADGEFSLQPGEGIFDQELTFSYLGYQPQTLLWSIDDGLEQRLEVRLKEGIDLPTVVLVYEKPLIQRDCCFCCCGILNSRQEDKPAAEAPGEAVGATAVTVYPNPFVASLFVRLEARRPGTWRFHLFTESGQLVYAAARELASGGQTVALEPDRQGLPEGMYFLRISGSDGEAWTERIGKVRP